ncbi:hypothetical protein MJO29_008861 [Puccinia striiformis f. sp. tritici]|uniref:Uncharacterized protein n=1 Tax=Puccinia striiformis f. sp. tritici PST-78 TaxID=1165861 RepID=A0A0L0V586_9BASI|nr:hypothetical protein Pst134EA_014968 [Puccinia striiformis f. sp. tritici]KAI9603306.1 hypothetical protein H4Q26_002625 [Puccinia striiformis f. sp. tritici PST-130]KNE94159.1 hypothetical protein PSTG_12489 [Puccinia striiformis f. sp. tritici PST-78]KAH9452131.1 hypothetical protein Pst134EB_016089 [Puccinia striiformis f. sp. tritici]KAH9462877.1 hypothetical protein Pst134EA_014968 [Puccinia striiformis f. sp. tritici]KAI7953230.1 hypothetical protein MJO29_008861 [Puccinia striiformis
MADWARRADSSTQAASVLRALVELEIKYEAPVQKAAGEVKDELTEGELEKKRLLLIKLESSLLPSIAYLLGSYLNSLDVREGSKSINPNFESILGMLSQLEEILDETKECIESATLDIIPLTTHDHHLKQFKDYRCTLLMLKIYDTVADFRMLFCDSTEFLEAWLDWSQDPESTECQKTTLKWVENVLRHAVTCNRTIGKTLKLIQASDFEIIQEEWQRNVGSMNAVIRFHTTLTSPTTSVQGNTSALRVHLTELAELTIPLIKLARIFPDRFTKRTPKKLPFRLDTELNSEILSKLHYNPAWVMTKFIVLVDILIKSHQSDSLIRDHTQMRNYLQDISQTLDSTLAILDFSLIPLSGGTNSGHHYKDRFLVWQDAWHRAVNNFMTTLGSFHDGHHEQQTAPER